VSTESGSMAALRDIVEKSITEAWLRRSDGKVISSPQEHCRFLADVVVASMRSHLRVDVVRIASVLERAYASFSPGDTEDADLFGHMARAVVEDFSWTADARGVRDRIAAVLGRVDSSNDGLGRRFSDEYGIDQETDRFVDELVREFFELQDVESGDVIQKIGDNDEEEALNSRREAEASCPGYEKKPNPCRCPCTGCMYHCSAHKPDNED